MIGDDVFSELTKGDLIIYEDEHDKIEIEAFLYDETIWLPLNKIAELFEKDKSDISRHINNIYNEDELNRNSTIANFATVQNEGLFFFSKITFDKSKKMLLYNYIKTMYSRSDCVYCLLVCVPQCTYFFIAKIKKTPIKGAFCGR